MMSSATSLLPAPRAGPVSSLRPPKAGSSSSRTTRCRTGSEAHRSAVTQLAENRSAPPTNESSAQRGCGLPRPSANSVSAGGCFGVDNTKSNVPTRQQQQLQYQQQYQQQQQQLQQQQQQPQNYQQQHQQQRSCGSGRQTINSKSAQIVETNSRLNVPLGVSPSHRSICTPTPPPLSPAPCPQLSTYVTLDYGGERAGGARSPGRALDQERREGATGKGKPSLKEVLQGGGGAERSQEELEKLRILAEHVQIYTDWANHYLQKCSSVQGTEGGYPGRPSSPIKDLQADISDGVKLADIICVIFSRPVPNINREPRNSDQAMNNVKSCLVFLVQNGINVNGIDARDIYRGKLKNILSLLFTLSLYKQQRHQQLQQQQHQQQQQQQQQQHQQQQQKLAKSAMDKSVNNPAPASASKSSKLPSALKKRSLPPTPGSNSVGGADDLSYPAPVEDRLKCSDQDSASGYQSLQRNASTLGSAKSGSRSGSAPDAGLGSLDRRTTGKNGSMLTKLKFFGSKDRGGNSAGRKDSYSADELERNNNVGKDGLIQNNSLDTCGKVGSDASRVPRIPTRSQGTSGLPAPTQQNINTCQSNGVSANQNQLRYSAGGQSGATCRIPTSPSQVPTMQSPIPSLRRQLPTSPKSSHDRKQKHSADVQSPVEPSEAKVQASSYAQRQKLNGGDGLGYRGEPQATRSHIPYSGVSQGMSGHPTQVQSNLPSRLPSALSIPSPARYNENQTGHTVQPGGHLVQPGGHLVQPGGHLMQLGGHLMQPGGHLVQPGGHLVQPGGHLVQPAGYSGHRVTSPSPVPQLSSRIPSGTSQSQLQTTQQQQHQQQQQQQQQQQRQLQKPGKTRAIPERKTSARVSSAGVQQQQQQHQQQQQQQQQQVGRIQKEVSSNMSDSSLLTAADNDDPTKRHSQSSSSSMGRSVSRTASITSVSSSASSTGRKQACGIMQPGASRRPRQQPTPQQEPRAMKPPSRESSIIKPGSSSRIPSGSTMERNKNRKVEMGDNAEKGSTGSDTPSLRRKIGSTSAPATPAVNAGRPSRIATPGTSRVPTKGDRRVQEPEAKNPEPVVSKIAHATVTQLPVESTARSVQGKEGSSKQPRVVEDSISASKNHNKIISSKINEKDSASLIKPEGKLPLSTKIDFDRPSSASSVQSQRHKAARPGSAKDANSTSWSSGFGEESASTSDSTDSVIYQPPTNTQSSCDELETSPGGNDDDDVDAVATVEVSTVLPAGARQTTDHIASLRQAKLKQVAEMNGKAAKSDTTEKQGGKMEGVKEMTQTTADTEEVDIFEIQPMPPILRTTRGGATSYLHSIPALSQTRRARPLIDASRLQVPLIRRMNAFPNGSLSTYSGQGLTTPPYSSRPEPIQSTPMVWGGPGGHVPTSSLGGYMSDGDWGHSDDMSSGYMSEGGSSLYSRPPIKQPQQWQRNPPASGGMWSEGGTLGGYSSDGGITRYARSMQQKFIEGMRAVRQSMDQQENCINDNDSLDDDCSSVSSGDISDSLLDGELDGSANHSFPTNSYNNSTGSGGSHVTGVSTNGGHRQISEMKSRISALGTIPGSQDSVDKLLGEELRKYRIKRTEESNNNSSGSVASLNLYSTKSSGNLTDQPNGGSTVSMLTPNHLTIPRASGGKTPEFGKPPTSSQLCGERLSNYSRECNTPNRLTNSKLGNDMNKNDSLINKDSSMFIHDSLQSGEGPAVLEQQDTCLPLFPRRQLFGCRRNSGGSGKGYHDYVNVMRLSGGEGGANQSCDEGSANQNARQIKYGSGGPYRMAMSETESMDNISGISRRNPLGGSNPFQRGSPAYSSIPGYGAMTRTGSASMMTNGGPGAGAGGQQRSASVVPGMRMPPYSSPSPYHQRVGAGGTSSSRFRLSGGSSSRDSNVHGSCASLGSSCSSIHSTTEEQQAQEIRKLRQELEAAQNKVVTLSTQLYTNAHVVSAFEQSLANMTQRLQLLAATTDQKDAELSELRSTIESLKQQSGRLNTGGGLGVEDGEGVEEGGRRRLSSDSCISRASQGAAAAAAASNGKKKQKNWLQKAFSRTKKGKGDPSDADMTSLCSELGGVVNSGHILDSLKSSQSEAMLSTQKDECVVLLEQQLHEKDMKLTDIRLEALSSAHQLEQLRETMNRMRTEMASLKANNDRLQQIVSQKGLEGELEQLTNGEAYNNSDKSNQSQQQQQRLSFGSPTDIECSLADSGSREAQSFSLSVQLTSSNSQEQSSNSSVLISGLGVGTDMTWEALLASVRKYFESHLSKLDPATSLGLSGDSIKCLRIANITWSKESTTPELLPCGYLVGENTNVKVLLNGAQEKAVDLLSYETLVPKPIIQRYASLLLEHRRIILCGPSGTCKTYLAQKLAEFLVLRSGASMTSESVVLFNVDAKSSKELRQYLSNIAERCLQQQTADTAADLPAVIILDSLHHVSSLADVFNGFLVLKHHLCPYIIGTMNQTTTQCQSPTNLQLHHNFRWILCANHTEPVRGFLSRYLRRRLITACVKTIHSPDSSSNCLSLTSSDSGDGSSCSESVTDRGLMGKVVDWLPQLWQHLNKFIESHNSTDVTIGPRLFLSCPMDVSGVQTWFTDLWNYSIIPYLLEAVREGIQTFGSRVAWTDPCDWVLETCPFSVTSQSEVEGGASLLRLRPEDVGFDSQALSGSAASSGEKKGINITAADDRNNDPLLNMLMRLQEAASFTTCPSPTTATNETNISIES